MTRQDEPWRYQNHRCPTCNKWWPVPSLATDCQQRHEQETQA